jgi:hypothetical protein
MYARNQENARLISCAHSLIFVMTEDALLKACTGVRYEKISMHTSSITRFNTQATIPAATSTHPYLNSYTLTSQAGSLPITARVTIPHPRLRKSHTIATFKNYTYTQQTIV